MCLTISLSEDRFWGAVPRTGLSVSHVPDHSLRDGAFSLVVLSRGDGQGTISFTYRLIYSRTRAYQTRPAVDLVSGEEGLSLSRPLRPPFHCDVPGGLYLLWYGVTGTRFREVRPRTPLSYSSEPGPSGDRGGMP